MEGRVTLREGDCRDVMLDLILEGVQVDAIVTDPPYHLTTVKRFGKKDAAPAKSNGPSGVYKRASAGFMGQAWDGGDIAFDPETWALCLKLLKPGGHLLAFSGTRTYHRMACAIEDAGFEIRDQIGWAFGTGFPKSHDVAKGIEKRRTEDEKPLRVVCRYLRAAMDAKKLKSKDLVKYFNDCHPRLIDHWAARDTDSQPSLPTPSQWLILKRALNLGDEMDAEVARLNARKGEFGETYLRREIVGDVREWTDRSNYALTSRDGKRRGRAISDEAAAWEGWGTALKPAWEPIVVARKPLSEKSVAANVLEHSTGALNIDGCRVPAEANRPWRQPTHAVGGNSLSGSADGSLGNEIADKSHLGRWPANLIHDGSDEVLALFPDSNGSGSAARFFYCPKASKKDRAGSKHPTVKPLDLMRYLCRLVTPPGGTVLDPFAGSGSTGQAAVEEGFRAVLIEREAEYIADIRRRLGLPASDTFADGIFA